MRSRARSASAGSWSTYDTFFGGGMVTDMMKYDRLDKAGQVIRQASDKVRVATAGVGETLEVLVRRRDAALEDLRRLRAEREQLLVA